MLINLLLVPVWERSLSLLTNTIASGEPPAQRQCDWRDEHGPGANDAKFAQCASRTSTIAFNGRK
jgi:hypothetical protein